MMLFKYSKSQRREGLSRVMMEKEQYEPWQAASIGYVSHPLRAYEQSPLWKSDPKNLPYSNSMKIMLPNGYSGPMATRRPRRWPTSSW